jgi:hypothetical protein
MDQMFENESRPVLQPECNGLVARAVIETPEGYRLYRERVKQVFTNIYRLEIITNRFDYLAKRNREAVAELGRGALNDYDNQIRAVRNRIIRRWEAAKDQIENEPAPMRFDQGPVAITKWRQQIELGNANVDRAEIDGKASLHISVDGHTSASWRSKVALEPGRYRFTANAKSAHLNAYTDEKGAGAGIRVSGANARRNKVLGDSPWTKLTFDFELPDPSEVTLVCEARATRGEVWFDRDSIKLEKLH